jgi:hypothetical protein
MKPQLTTIICLLLLFCIFGNAKAYAPPLVVYPLNIKFNYTSGHFYDALEIKKNYSTNIPVPEWYSGVTCAPAAYIKTQSARRVQVRFYCNYPFNKQLTVYNSDLSNGIGSLDSETFSYSGYISSYITFTSTGIVPSSVGIRYNYWRWQIHVEFPGYPYGAGNYTSYTVNPYYKLLATPQDPMPVPWTDVLNYACDWANGTGSEFSALTAITEGAYWNFDVEYDGNQTHSSGTTCDLTGLLNSSKADCQDMSALVHIFTRALGGNETKVQKITSAFDTKEIDPIGSATWVEMNWNFHQVAWKWNVWDACLRLDEQDPRIPMGEPIDDPYKKDLDKSDDPWSLEDEKSYVTVY